MNILEKGKKLYWGLVFTFAILYLAVAAVSTIHAISFFQLSNVFWLAVVLGIAYEVGQATVLFSILMTENKNKFMPWLMMLALTALQITANVYASFKFMDTNGADWEYWQRSILFALKDASPEQNKIVISWISGALLPLIALGMTALVAENIKIMGNEDEEIIYEEEDEESSEDNEIADNFDPGNDWIAKEKADEIIENEVKKRLEEEKEKDLKLDKNIEEKIVSEYKKYDDINKKPIPKGLNLESSVGEIKPYITIPLDGSNNVLPPFKTNFIPSIEKLDKEEEEYRNHAKEQIHSFVDKTKNVLEKIDDSSILPTKEEMDKIDDGVDEFVISNKKIEKKEGKKEEKKSPVNKMRGWHLMKEYIDDENNIFKKGKYIGKDPDKTPTSKKA
jgi:hypothetical protein